MTQDIKHIFWKMEESDKNFLYTNLTLHLVYELLQLVDLGAPVVVWLHTDPWYQKHNFSPAHGDDSILIF